MQIRESLPRDLIRLIFWYPVRWVLVALPPKGAFAVLRRMGDLHRLLSRGKREALANGLNILQRHYSFPDAVCREALRTSFRNHYIDRFIMFVSPRMTRQYVEREIAFEGLEHLDAALRKGKGAVVCIAHFGPVHVPLNSLARLGYPMLQVGMPSDKGLSWIGRNVAFRLRLRYEAKMPARIINADGFMRPALRWLNENKVLMVTGDGSGTEQRFGKHHCYEFCGLPVDFPLGPARICQKTGAELLALFILPGKDTLFRIVVEPPLIHDEEEREQPELLTGRFVALLEQYVGQCPGYPHFLDRLDPRHSPSVVRREPCPQKD